MSAYQSDVPHCASSYPPAAPVRYRSVNQIVEHQIMLWEAREHAHRIAPQVSQHWPVVTISREFGTAGARVGERLAELLGFAFWDRRMLEAIAHMLHSTVPDLDPIDERAPGAIEEFLSMVLHVTNVPSRELCDALCQLVHTLERHGSAVIVGRGAPFIVAPSHALRVRIIAPLEQRIADHAAREGLDLAAARSVVIHTDRDRHAYIEHRFHAKAEDPLHYDLVLNVARLPVDHAADLLREAYRCKFGRLPGVPAELSPPRPHAGASVGLGAR